MLIAFEGIDGSGKTTQAEMLSDRLTGLSIRNTLVREPGGTQLGEGVRELLLHRTDLRIHPVTEFFLFTASRSQLVREKVIPLLKDGSTVILDRYFYSSIAYQGFGRGLPVDRVEAVSEFAIQDVLPDLVFVVKVDPEDALKRRLLSGRGSDRMEDSELQFFRRVSDGFKYCADREPNRFVVVDGADNVEKISNKIFDIVMSKMRKVMEERNAT